MKLKTIVAATLLGVSSFAANALSVTGLDSISGPLQWKLRGVTTEFNTQSGTNETTWGVGSISEIASVGGPGSTNQIWQAGTSDGTYLYYMIYGIADLNIVDDGAGGFKIYNVGATGTGTDGLIHLDLFRTNTVINSLMDFTADPNLRTGYGGYSLLDSLGPAYLSVTFGTGKQTINRAALPQCDGTNGTTGDGTPCMTNPSANELLSTIVQNTDGAQLPASGDGNFFADVVGGTAATKWDTDALFGHDFDGHFTLIPNLVNFGGACTQAQLDRHVCFEGNINDPIRASAIPEPGSMMLAGLGLVGLAALRRRKQA